MKKAASDTLNARQLAELSALAALPDTEIDIADIPELADWRGAQRGLFHRPLKQQITLRLDAEVIEWFRRQAPDGSGYQTKINAALRSYIAAKRSKA